MFLEGIEVAIEMETEIETGVENAVSTSVSVSVSSVWYRGEGGGSVYSLLLCLALLKMVEYLSLIHI